MRPHRVLGAASRLPRGTPTTWSGIAHIKDLIELALSSKGKRAVSKSLRDATFVPDTKDILPLLSEMQTAHEQMVVVVDEYGGTAGIITIEDIVEEIVGEIEDEFDPDNKYLTRLSRREWLVDGRFSCDDAVELGWPHRGERRLRDHRRLDSGAFATASPTSARSSRSRGTSSRCSPCAGSGSRSSA